MTGRPVANFSDGSRLVSLDPTAGHEQQGTRPVLIVSPTAFNRLTKAPVVLPITSGVIRCDQPRALDLAARNGRKLEKVPPAIMEEVLARLATLFE